MTSKDELAAATAQIDECERLVDRLHAMCCEPDRSPRMLAILDDLRSVRDAIERVDDPITAGDATRMLERIGAQVGYLQVACCTAARMPLYNDVLNGLATTQIHVATSVGQAH